MNVHTQSLKVRRLGYALGAEVSGVDIRSPLESELELIRRAILDHVVVCISGQHGDAGAEDLRNFARHFGKLDDYRNYADTRHPEATEVFVLSNKPVIVNGKAAGGMVYAKIWHADLTFTDRPTSLSFLLAKTIPDIGGDTLFANMYLAYERLSPAFAAAVEQLEAVHDIMLSPATRRSSAERQAQIRKDNPPAIHPVVQTHPETGRKAMCVGERISHFDGMTEEESQPLLAFLNQHATAYELTYRHRWNPGDLVIWDNRCALHYAVYDYDETQLRQMLRCSLLGPKRGRLVP